MEKLKQHFDSKNRKSTVVISVVLIIAMMASMMLASCSSGSIGQGDKTGSDITASRSEDDDRSNDKKSDDGEDKSDDSEKADKKADSDTGNKKDNSSNNSSNSESRQENAAAQTTQTTQAKSVCYISIDGYCSSKSIEVRSGDTVYSILCRSGASVSGSSSYVKGINGLFEFYKGPQSGWKYSVNGVTPGVGCGSYSVKAGDNIRWYYVTHL